MIGEPESVDDAARRLRPIGRQAIRLARLGEERVELDVLDDEGALLVEPALHGEAQAALAAALLAEDHARARRLDAPVETVERGVHGLRGHPPQHGVLVCVLLDEGVLVERPVVAPGVREHRAVASRRRGCEVEGRPSTGRTRGGSRGDGRRIRGVPLGRRPSCRARILHGAARDRRAPARNAKPARPSTAHPGRDAGPRRAGGRRSPRRSPCQPRPPPRGRGGLPRCRRPGS